MPHPFVSFSVRRRETLPTAGLQTAHLLLDPGDVRLGDLGGSPTDLQTARLPLLHGCPEDNRRYEGVREG